MNVLTRLLNHFGFIRRPPYTIYLDRKLFAHLSYLAAQQHIPLDELVEAMLKQDVTERYTAVANLQLWEGLSPREKQVAALTCLGYTNEEIAEQMVISANTVKTHMRNVLGKCTVSSKVELQQVLSGWDFREWLATQDFLAEPDSAPTNSASPNGVNS